MTLAIAGAVDMHEGAELVTVATMQHADDNILARQVSTPHYAAHDGLLD